MIAAPEIRPAPYGRRVLAMIVDYGAGVGLLALVWPWLPESPPTDVPSMSFYTSQQFINYFTLVGVVCLIPLLNGVLHLITPWKGTIGHLIAKIQLTPLDDRKSLGRVLLGRTMRTLFGLLFLCLPGPVIALLIALVVGMIFSIPFSTGDQMLRSVGAPDWLRVGLHLWSFILLLIALWYIALKPILRVLYRRHFQTEGGITPRDYATDSTYIVRP